MSHDCDCYLCEAPERARAAKQQLACEVGLHVARLWSSRGPEYRCTGCHLPVDQEGHLLPAPPPLEEELALAEKIAAFEDSL